MSTPAGAQQLPVPAARLPLQAQAEQIVSRASGDWSVVAWSIDRGEPIFAIHPDEVRIPASNNKVFTSIWALDVLGPDHRFTTDLLIGGPITRAGVLQGDVFLRGSGDPSFGYPEFTPEPMEPLRRMARELYQRGVRTVEGRVLGDGTAFDTLLIGPAWPRDTGGGSAAYAPRVSGLSFQRNLLWIYLTPVAGGGLAQVRLQPATEAIPVLSSARSGGNRAWAVRREDDDTIRVMGGVAGRNTNRYGVGVAQPTLLAAGALRQALIEAGIEVRGPAAVGQVPAGARVVHRHWSIPLGAMIPKLNQNSDNFFAEHLWKAAALRVLGEGSYMRGGPASALHFIQRAGVTPGQLYQADGSGLSEYNRTSANALVRALLYADRQPWSELFHRSLAVAASPTGTMRRLFQQTAAANNLHAKTGYIRGVRSLSGYVTARNGERIVFSFLYNGRNTNGARTVESELGTLLAEHGAPAPGPVRERVSAR